MNKRKEFDGKKLEFQRWQRLRMVGEEKVIVKQKQQQKNDKLAYIVTLQMRRGVEKDRSRRTTWRDTNRKRSERENN